MATIAASSACIARAAVGATSFRGQRLAATSNGARCSMRATWIPGVTPPAHLDGSLPGDRGYDPVGIAKDPILLKRYTEAEVFHGRLAMFGVLGSLTTELEGKGNWLQLAHTTVDGLKDGSYILTLPPLAIPATGAGLLIFHLVALSEGARLKGEIEYGYEGSIDPFTYPGFDPLEIASNGTPEEVADWRTREIKNGRLAMIAWLGYAVQGYVTGKGPIENLQDHLANPSVNWLFG